MKKLNKKTLAIVISVVLVLAITVGATLAYLHSESGYKSNTFSFVDRLTVTLNDEVSEYKIIPGQTAAQDTTITLSEHDVPAYVYVIVQELNTKYNNKTIVDWAIAEGWTAMDYAAPDAFALTDLFTETAPSAENTKIFYRTVDASYEAATFNVLADNQVSYPANVVRTDVPLGTEIKLNFAAVAIQTEGFGSALAAWVGEPLPTPNITVDTAPKPIEFKADPGATETNPVTLNANATFQAPETAEQVVNSPYKDWKAEFKLNLNQQLTGTAGQGGLFGEYGDYGWIGMIAPDVSQIPMPVNVLELFGFSGEVTYSDICTFVSTFNCGMYIENPPEGLIATLELVVIRPDDNAEFVVSTNEIPSNPIN